MEYLLNKTPIRTTNSFKINDLKVDFDYIEDSFDELFISKCENIKLKKEIKSNFDSLIGLKSSKYFYLDIDVLDDILEPIFISYDFSLEKKFLADQITINLNGKNCNFVILFTGNNKCIHNFKLVVNATSNSNSNISVINLLNKESNSFISFENNLEKDSKVCHNFLDLSGNLRVSNYYSNLKGEGCINKLNNVYVGKSNDRIDMNYYIKCLAKNTNAIINCIGCLNEYSYKSFKGTIDFKRGSSKSIGHELEKCILLSDSCKSKSLPVILCEEEDIVGTHGVSTGKIDSKKLFYLMSKGISEHDAKVLIVTSLFNTVIDKIDSKEIRDKLFKQIEEMI